MERAFLLTPVGPYALEDAGPVVQAVGRRGEPHVAELYELAAVVGPVFVGRGESLALRAHLPPPVLSPAGCLRALGGQLP